MQQVDDRWGRVKLNWNLFVNWISAALSLIAFVSSWQFNFASHTRKNARISDINSDIKDQAEGVQMNQTQMFQIIYKANCKNGIIRNKMKFDLICLKIKIISPVCCTVVAGGKTVASLAPIEIAYGMFGIPLLWRMGTI